MVMDNVLQCRTTKSDPAVEIAPEKYPQEVPAAEIIAIRVTARANINSVLEIFYTTSADENLDQTKSFNTTIGATEDFREYTISTAGKSAWKDMITSFRFDIIREAGEFDVAKIELITRDESSLPITVTVDNKAYNAPFMPWFWRTMNCMWPWQARMTASSACMISTMSGAASPASFASLPRKTTRSSSTLTAIPHLLTARNKSLPEKVTLRDGLPVLPLFFLYKIEGIDYTFENKAVTVSTLDKKYQEIIKNRVPYEFEFDVPGDTEGFAPEPCRASFRAVSFRATHSNVRVKARYTIRCYR